MATKDVFFTIRCSESCQQCLATTAKWQTKEHKTDLYRFAKIGFSQITVRNGMNKYVVFKYFFTLLWVEIVGVCGVERYKNTLPLSAKSGGITLLSQKSYALDSKRHYAANAV